ncbi:hypothetical protein [Bacillus sp. KH172YL63]|uniref:hypothetical protein n=1 Tax=Bacillus sp. KH172YL63 TaxID=2709784 RepID=UPI0013E49FB0|nr:hypothetical protein [Bacillus sp. KH172YL63]BCB03948.1 hypothetical protein KH172YL63_20810 [Bacillus sp. KH172YL63]
MEIKKRLGLISCSLFALSAVAYVVMLTGYDGLLFMGALLALAGLITALFSEKGLYKRIGLIGNGTLLVIVILVPTVVTTFFWNTP